MTARTRIELGIIAGKVQFHPINVHRISLHPVAGRTWQPATAPASIVLAPLAPCSHHPSLIILVSDESGSVTSHNDPDRPIGGRRREKLLALDRLGTCRCGSELVANLYFPSSTHGIGPLPLNGRGQRDLRNSIINPPASTSSCLDEPLDTAYALAAAHSEHDVTLIVFSDFELFDPDPDGTLERFRQFPGSRHAVVLGAPVPAALDADPTVVVSRITWDSQPGEVAQAIIASLAEIRNA